MAARCLCSTPPLARGLDLSVRIDKLHSRIASPLSVPPQLRNCRTVSAFRIGRRHERKLNPIHAAAAVDDDGRGDDGGPDESNKGRQLWRTELLSNEFESLDDEVRQSSTLQRDIERLTKKEEVAKLLSKTVDGSRKDEALEQRGGGGVRDIVDKVLVADFFFILFVLGWLIAGLVERAALESTSLIDSWLPLWPSVFQPALGVFMAGALISAVTKKE